jgi:hypothetical protein
MRPPGLEREIMRLAQEWLPNHNAAQSNAMRRAAESLRIAVGIDRALAKDIIAVIRAGCIAHVSIECGPGRDGWTDAERRRKASGT